MQIGAVGVRGGVEQGGGRWVTQLHTAPYPDNSKVTGMYQPVSSPKPFNNVLACCIWNSQERSRTGRTTTGWIREAVDATIIDKLI